MLKIKLDDDIEEIIRKKSYEADVHNAPLVNALLRVLLKTKFTVEKTEIKLTLESKIDNNKRIQVRTKAHNGNNGKK